MSNATRHDMTLGQVHAITNSFHTVTMNEKKCKLQIATNRFSPPHARALENQFNPSKAGLFLLLLWPHIFQPPRELSIDTERESESERARARESERESESESERKPAPLFISMLSCAVHVCVSTRAARTFSSFEKKKSNFFLVGWLLAHTPPSSFLFFFGLLATYIHDTKMYILGNKGFSFSFHYLPRGW